VPFRSTKHVVVRISLTVTPMKALGNDFVMTCKMSSTFGTRVDLWTIKIYERIIQFPCPARLGLGNGY
jgi:hypothetical protein